MHPRYASLWCQLISQTISQAGHTYHITCSAALVLQQERRVLFVLDSCAFTQSKLCLCECGEVPATVSPLQLTYCMKSQTHRQIIDFIIITRVPISQQRCTVFFSNIPQAALRYCAQYPSGFTHTHSPHHTQCLVFRFIKPQCYPEWLTG